MDINTVIASVVSVIVVGSFTWSFIYSFIREKELKKALKAELAGIFGWEVENIPNNEIKTKIDDWINSNPSPTDKQISRFMDDLIELKKALSPLTEEDVFNWHYQAKPGAALVNTVNEWIGSTSNQTYGDFIEYLNEMDTANQQAAFVKAYPNAKKLSVNY